MLSLSCWRGSPQPLRLTLAPCWCMNRGRPVGREFDGDSLRPGVSKGAFDMIGLLLG